MAGLLEAGRPLNRLLASLLTLILWGSLALASPHALLAQTVKGLVFDDDTRMPLGGASVNILAANFEELVRGQSDALGRFEYVLPDTGTFLVAASMGGYAASAPEVVILGLGEEVTVMLPLWSLDPEPAGVEVRPSSTGGSGVDLFGQVVEYKTGRPIENAEVGVVGQALADVTDSNGRFFIRDAPAASERLYIQHLSYAPREAQLEMSPGVAYELVVRMEPEPLEIPGIEVSATSKITARRLEPVFARMDRAVTAHFRTEKDFEVRGHPPVGSMIQGLPRVRVQNRGPMWAVYMGGAMRLDGRACVPVVYLDGMKVSNPEDPTSLSEFLNMSTFDVAVIEVYPGAASLPPEFNDPGAMCAIGIWTKRGGD